MITNKFNASSENVYRDMHSLKKADTNIKMQVRKEVANDRVEALRTGGGYKKPSNNPLTEITLDTINSKTVYELKNNLDCDKTTEEEEHPLLEVLSNSGR